MEVFWFLLFSLFSGIAAFIVFLYHLKKGQFEDGEEPKYQMFREDD